MNKKNIVFIAQSLDGYIAGKNGELEWLHSIPNPDNNDMGFSDLIQEVDAIIMGRTTFETVVGFGVEWPYTKPVFVLSHSLKRVPSGFEKKATLISGTPSKILTQLHKVGYQNLYIDGGVTIQNFLEHDLIDELRITTIPILLGGGSSLFGVMDASIDYELISSKVYLNQIVQTHYRRKK